MDSTPFKPTKYFSIGIARIFVPVLIESSVAATVASIPSMVIWPLIDLASAHGDGQTPRRSSTTACGLWGFLDDGSHRD
nr:hypothetical protein [Mesorhizobium albiziae]